MKYVNKLSILALALSVSAVATGKEISVSSKAGYHDAAVVPDKIKSECTELGMNFSESTKKYLDASGWQTSLAENVESLEAGVSIKLEIMNAMSAGNAFIGHQKSVAISASLYRDGKLVDTYRTSRNSAGGFGAGFKSSCDVLYRTVNTLGNDVAKWVNNKESRN